jgi:large subunit ribosomal protein L15
VTSFAEEMTALNLDTLQSWISQGRLDPEKPITIRELCKSGAVNSIKDGVKLLARGATVLTTPIHIVVSRASEQAIQAVEAQGGTVTTRFYTQGAIRRIRQGLMDPYVSLRWDPEQIGIPVLIPLKPHSPEDRVKGMGYRYRLPDPTSRKEMQYYRNWKNRGYLAHTVKEGEVADLFWKPDLRSSDQFEAARRRKSVKSEVADNRLW